MRIALYHGPLYRDPLHRGADGYETYGPYARYVHEFARHFDEVVVLGPVTSGETHYRGCSLDAQNVRVVELPDFSTHVQASGRLPTIFQTLRREIGHVDVVNCRHSAPFGYLLYFLGRSRGVGFFYHITSDPAEILAVGSKYRGLFGYAARFAYGMDFAIQRYVMRRTYSFVNGRLPYERLKNITDRIEPIISSTLIGTDFRVRTDLGLHDPVRLLYVGYLKHMKGLSYLIDALQILLDKGQAVELHLVGAGPQEDALRKQIGCLHLSQRVHFHGYVPMGPDLNRHYDEADIFLFPSLSEGSPRVVLEALAHSLPVVSTNVGSVPELIVDGESGLIVPPRDAAALGDAVMRYTQDEALRARCASAGYAAAQPHTVERFVQPLVEKAKELVRKKDIRP